MEQRVCARTHASTQARTHTHTLAFSGVGKEADKNCLTLHPLVDTDLFSAAEP